MLSDQEVAKVLADLGAMHVMYGKPEPSAAVLNILLDDIEAFGACVIGKAFKRLRTTFDGRQPITSALLLRACEAVSGRLTADEAWSVALAARDESQTVVWTDEIEQAWWSVKELVYGLPKPDLVAARRSFIEAYERLVAASRDAGRHAVVTASLGTDKELQSVALETASRRGFDVSHLRGSEIAACLGLPAPPQRLLERGEPKQPSKVLSPQEVRANVERLKALVQQIPQRQEAERQARLEAERQAWQRRKAEQDALVALACRNFSEKNAHKGRQA